VRGSLLAWVDRMVTADLIVSSGARTAGPRNVPLKEDLLRGLKDIPGVKIVDLYRLIRSTYEGQPIVIESFSAAESAPARNLPVVDGDGAQALREMGEGRGVIISESFQARFGKARNDTLELATPTGRIAFKILAVYVDYSSDSGSVLLDRALYKKYWRDELVDAFDLWLAPGAYQQAVIQNIKADHGEKYQLFVSTHREPRRRGAHHGAVVRRKLRRRNRRGGGGNLQRNQYAAGVDSRSHTRDRRAARHRRDPGAGAQDDCAKRVDGAPRRYSWTLRRYHHVLPPRCL
jgi:hypothetical protein